MGYNLINPNDEFGLTRAMWFKEKQGASCMSPMLVFPKRNLRSEKRLPLVPMKPSGSIWTLPMGSPLPKQLAQVVKDGAYDPCRKESIDYNGGWSPECWLN